MVATAAAARSQRRHRLAGRSRDPRLPAGHVAHVLRRAPRQRPRLHDGHDDGVRRTCRSCAFFLRYGAGRSALAAIVGDLRGVGGHGAGDGRGRTAGCCARSAPQRLKRVLSYVQFLAELRRVWRLLRRCRACCRCGVIGQLELAEVAVAAAPSAGLVRELSRARGGPRDRPLEIVAGARVGRRPRRSRERAQRQAVARIRRSAGRAHDRRRPPAPARARPPGALLFTRDEARAVALLVRSQFRNDIKFRMGVLTILPLTLVYL